MDMEINNNSDLDSNNNNDNNKIKNKKTAAAIQWRRSIVLQRLACGNTQTEIARELQVTQGTISGDCQVLTEEANEKLKDFIDTKIPIEIEKTVALYDKIIHDSFQISDNTQDEKTKIQAMNSARDSALAKIDIITNGNVIKNVLNLVSDLKDKTKNINTNNTNINTNTQTVINQDQEQDQHAITETEEVKEEEENREIEG